jgi:CHAT domain-containing protein
MTHERGRVLAGLAGAMLIVAFVSTGEAQRGFGAARPATGEYSFDFDEVLEAIDRGEGRQALAYYERVAAEAEQHGDRLRAARAFSAAAVAARRLGLFQEAIRTGTRSIELFKSVELAPADPGRFATAYAQVGTAYRLVGNLPQARTVLEEGLAFFEARLGGGREGIQVGFLSSALAYVAYSQRDYQASLTRSSQAAQFFEDVLVRLPAQASERRKLNMRRQAADSLVAVGRAQLALGHPDEAGAAYDRALKYARLVGLSGTELDIIYGQGNVAIARQDWAKAASLYRGGLTLATQSKNPAVLMWLNDGLARALGELGRTDEALGAAREAVRLALQAQRPEEAFALAERSRARAFLDLLGSQTTLSKGRTRALIDEEVRLRARLAEAQARVEEAREGNTSEHARALVEAAARDYRAFLDRVRKESLEQASLMTVEPVTLAEIQNLLPEGTTLLEYLVGDRDVIIWIVDRSHATVARMPGDRHALVDQVRRFRGAIASQAPLADVEAQAQALYRQLLGPARGEVRGNRLLIVPHGALHYLPFAALRSPGGRWVVEDFALATLPSASVLRYLADKSAGAPDRALVVGNPDVGAGLALRWAEREARMVGQRERGATVLVRGDATEARVKTLLETVGLVHLATHGELSESDPLSSALLLVPGEKEDGRLEVRELFGLDLHARLVVLSACETGLGKLSRGDELVGLQRALLYAGTAAVLTTLWKVDDRASYELMRAFYDRLAGAGPAEALRQAQLETIRAFPHPFAWAAFGLTGVPR